MNCYICNDEMLDGRTSLTFDFEENVTYVIRNVPAHICKQCGEVFVNLSVSKTVEKKINEARKTGLKIGFLEYDILAA